MLGRSTGNVVGRALFVLWVSVLGVCWAGEECVVGAWCVVGRSLGCVVGGGVGRAVDRNTMCVACRCIGVW